MSTNQVTLLLISIKTSAVGCGYAQARGDGLDHLPG